MMGIMKKALLLALVLTLGASSIAFAESDFDRAGQFTAGTIASVNGAGFVLKTRAGEMAEFAVTERTTFRSPDGSVSGLGDLRVGMGAAVRSLAVEDGSQLALLVVVVPDADRFSHVRTAQGEITQVIPGQSTFSLQARDGHEYSFEVSDRTRFKSKDGSIEDLHDLKKGMVALVAYVTKGDGTLMALLVAAGPKEDVVPEKSQASGEITGVFPDRSAFTLRTRNDRELTIHVNERTQYRSKDGSVQGLEDLEEGMLAHVVGIEKSDGSLLALQVVAGTKDQLPENIRVEGEITQVVPGQSTFDLLTTEGRQLSFEVNDRTRFRSPDGSIEDIHDLKRGMQAGVLAIVRSDGTLLALVVSVGRDQQPRPEAFRASGEISGVNPGQSTFSLMTQDGRELSIEVIERTKFRSPNGSVEGIHDLKQGMRAFVVGYKKADGTHIALLVAATKPGERPRNVEKETQRFIGRIAGVGGTSFTISTQGGETVSFVVIETTVFRGVGGGVTGIGDLEVGMVAAVGAVDGGNGQWMAVWVAAGKIPERFENPRNPEGGSNQEGSRGSTQTAPGSNR